MKDKSTDIGPRGKDVWNDACEIWNAIYRAVYARTTHCPVVGQHQITIGNQTSWCVSTSWRNLYPQDQRDQHTFALRESPGDWHPAVRHVLMDNWYPTGPDGLAGLVLASPVVSEDGLRLAYFQTEAKGHADTRTATATGKYLKRMWPYLPDHYIRDVVARHQQQTPYMVHTVDEFIEAVNTGPRSCMSDGGDEDDPEFDPHPYKVYDPRLGWRMALRKDNDGRIDARALVLHASRGPWTEGETLQGSIFVRTYRRYETFTRTCESLQAWLKAQGCEKPASWPDDAYIRAIESDDTSGKWLMPYIDGCDKGVSACCGRHNGLAVHSLGGGSLDGEVTVGWSTEGERITCTHCDETYPEDAAGARVGYYGDEWVCQSCLDDDFVHGYGRNGRMYWFRADNARASVNGYWYHEDYLGDNEMVDLANGDLCSESDAFECPIRGEWYHVDDGVVTEDEGMVHHDEAWKCSQSGDWYSTNEDHVWFERQKCHPDNVPEKDTEPASPFDLPYNKPEGSISNDRQVELPLPPPPVPAPVTNPELDQYLDYWVNVSALRGDPGTEALRGVRRKGQTLARSDELAPGARDWNVGVIRIIVGNNTLDQPEYWVKVRATGFYHPSTYPHCYVPNEESGKFGNGNTWDLAEACTANREPVSFAGDPSNYFPVRFRLPDGTEMFNTTEWWNSRAVVRELEPVLEIA